MATLFGDLVNGMINVSFGAAAVAAEKSKDVLDGLNAKGAEVRNDPETPDFARSVSDMFTVATDTAADVTERLNARGESMTDKVLDEIIRARVRPMDASGRADYVKHIENLVANIDTDPIKVKVESVEVKFTTEPEEAEAVEAEVKDE